MKRFLFILVILGVLLLFSDNTGVNGRRSASRAPEDTGSEIFLLENDETDAGENKSDENESGQDGENTGETDETEDPGTEDEPEDDDPFPRSAVRYPISDDLFSTTQYSLHNIGKYNRYIGEEFIEYSSVAGIDLDVARGWTVYSQDGRSKSPVIVAVIDSGIDYEHPDLKGKMWTNPGEIPDNGIDDDLNGYIDDVYGWDFYNNDNTVCHYSAGGSSAPDDCDDHGTRVAGLITAVKDNGIGIAGIASVGNIRIMSLKIHGGSARKGKLADAIKAIKYAERMGASICNISWGTYTYSAPLASAIKHSKMLFVCAAGNDGTNNDNTPIYPASFGFDNVISVGFVNPEGVLSYNSNYGQKSVDIVVPSTDIMSTVVGGYSSTGGSSMAAPQVSAIAALIYSYDLKTWPGAVRSVIIDSLKDPGDLEKIIKYPGIPSLYSALSNIEDLQSDRIDPSFTINVGYDSGGIRIAFNTSDRGGSGILKISYMIGAHKREDFRNGTEGQLVENNLLYLSKPGTYTFFVEDRAGNSTVKTLPILDDIVLPTILDAQFTADVSLSSMLITAKVTDSHSGIRTIKYMPGRHTAADFKRSDAGTPLSPDTDGFISFAVSEQGPYTIYAADNRGNITVKTIMAYMRRFN